jgi:hypothetical protein
VPVVRLVPTRGGSSRLSARTDQGVVSTAHDIWRGGPHDLDRYRPSGVGGIAPMGAGQVGTARSVLTTTGADDL